MLFNQCSENEWVTRAQKGDKDAFGELVLTHQKFVYNLALRMLGNTHEAEDLSQEAFLRAWLALPGFRSQSQFRTWLYRIVVNLCYNRRPQIRRDIQNIPTEDEDEMEMPIECGPENHAEREELRKCIHEQVDRLPESHRLLIMLRYQKEMSYEEIAAITSLPLGTVKTGLFRARQQLQQAMLKRKEMFVWSE